MVSIPHKLGKDEAIRRMKAGLGSVKTGYGQLLQVNENIWSGDRLAFRVTALKQQASGTIDASEDHVGLEVTLPWLLAGLAHGAQAMNPRARSAHAGEEIVQPRVMAPEADMGTSMRSPSFKNIEKNLLDSAPGHCAGRNVHAHGLPQRLLEATPLQLEQAAQTVCSKNQ